MFQQNHVSVWEPLALKFFQGFRPTVAGILVTPNGKGVVLVQHTNGPAYSFIPPQGDIRRLERVGAALHREVQEELPGFTLDLSSLKLLGDCINRMPPTRGLPHKWMFWVAARCQELRTNTFSAEIDGVQIVWSSEHLQGFFSSGQIRRQKMEMIVTAVNAACDHGLLAWRYEGLHPAAIAAGRQAVTQIAGV